MYMEILQNDSAWLAYSAILDLKSKYEVLVEGIGGFSHTRTKCSTVLTISSTYSDFALKINALVISSITSITPAVHVDVNQWKHLDGLQLADTYFGTPGSIDVLIGADIWGLIVQGEVISGESEEPHAQSTRLGWVVFGPALAASTSMQRLHTFKAKICEGDTRLEDLVRNFWKLEEVAEKDIGDDECGRIFAATHSRTPDGRYVVHVIFRDDVPQLADSYANALRQFHSLERRLADDEELRHKYITFMREYAALGHMEYVDQPGDHTNCYYIPHHAVQGKFRVVFNASSRTVNGVSLNDIQLGGPTIQDSLVNIIFRFRRYRIALTADIEKMFRQVLVTPEHRDFQRILWRESPTSVIGVYRLTTITYGMACSPYNAVCALHQCAYDNYNRVTDPNQAVNARDTILTSFYVDDFLTSCNSVNEAVVLATNVDVVLSAGHFKLRKWNSNNTQVINLVADDSPTAELVIDSPITSVLGLRWDPVADELFFKVNLEPCNHPLTKRRVLSEVAQLFDPTGLLAPVVITGKIFIQTLWLTGITWDAPLPEELQATWIGFRDGLDALNRVRVPRWLGMENGEVTALHGFCDASSRAYAAVIYAHTTSSKERSRVRLLTARTKVAPLKGATIPRLELCAAHLLAVMLENVRVALGLTSTPFHLWSDSRIVLCWLRKQPTTLKPYVSNRVRQIQELTSPDHWRHIRSAQNPADCASRGMGAAELLEHRLWWNGPEWLMKDPVPSHPEREGEFGPDELSAMRDEEKLSVLSTVATVGSTLTTRRCDGLVIPLTERFSSLQTLLRTVARILRWSPRRRCHRETIVSADELDDALGALIRMEQGNIFTSEIHQLQRGSCVSSSSRLFSLNPYLDKYGILKVGGRIGKASVPHDHRFSIILPKTSGLVWLLIQQAHQSTLHGGTQLMLQTLRSRYWILNARQAVRNFQHNCVICRRHRGDTLNQQMASLPRQRVNAARPFLSSGVDYCGPFTLRTGTKRSRTTIETYLAIFICMVTKAVHIEVVEDLSSQAFLDSFTRFISRRGPCRDLYSDNGTAFIGANRMLQEDLVAWHSEHNQQSLSSMGTKWHFITPSAPHQGGLWEAAVKSAKHHLVRLVGGQAMWYHQLHTLATRIEACLNSRPLTPLHEDPDDKFALTPGDFLIGAPLIAVPEPSVNDIPINRVKQWQWLRQLHQHFWKRWSEEYLSTLQTRNKWQRRSDNIREGDIVIVRRENLPPTHWRLGRVIQVHPGSDGLARNATLRTASGMCTRAVQKLCRLLEAESLEQNSIHGQNQHYLTALAPFLQIGSTAF